MNKQLLGIIIIFFIIHFLNIIIPFYIDREYLNYFGNFPIAYLPKLIIIQTFMFIAIRKMANVNLNKWQIFGLSIFVSSGAYTIGELVIYLDLDFHYFSETITNNIIGLICAGIIMLFTKVYKKSIESIKSNPEIIDDLTF